MKKEEIKLIVSISIAIATILGISYLIILDKSFDLSNGLRAISFGITSTTFFWTFYFTYGWKIWGLDKVFYRPNLSGTWAGILRSDWKDENGNGAGDIEFYIVIRQSFLRIHFTTFTDSFIGTSYSETLSLKKETGLKNAAYLYRKETSQDENEFLQEGATELRIIESNPKKLEGKYWSNQKTNGKIDVSFISKKIVDSFNDAKTLNNNGK
ncbi:Cap15 family cyclic dinucleotide receptor domain-containing protein [Algoriphagus halophilus]|uniref:CD-NTase-associated protein 15 domain-containing protein n=1 Tax=Algoriphagus halophilus TaxID=226505 RepID=A0A1N6GII9_9BACT|nr:hypothetical protein [Algoriphagus halophilus]SIO07337.1 hypothetical protein SAMN05444394_3279 [Algoriphagus halophilus]